MKVNKKMIEVDTEKLNQIIDFINRENNDYHVANNSYNESLQSNFYKSCMTGVKNPGLKALNLLYWSFETQSGPQIDSTGPTFKIFFGEISQLERFESFWDLLEKLRKRNKIVEYLKDKYDQFLKNEQRVTGEKLKKFKKGPDYGEFVNRFYKVTDELESLKGSSVKIKDLKGKEYREAKEVLGDEVRNKIRPLFIDEIKVSNKIAMDITIYLTNKLVNEEISASYGDSKKNHNLFESLFNNLKVLPGWGPKTSALFIKALIHIHSKKNLKKLAFWKDLKKLLSNYNLISDRLYLPVDRVIIAIFKALEIENADEKISQKDTEAFDQINYFLHAVGYNAKEVLSLDDLWFWGFFNQFTVDENRIHRWNENKFWAEKFVNKDQYAQIFALSTEYLQFF